MTFRRWQSSRLATVALSLTVALFATRADAGELTRIKYMWLDKPSEAIGEIDLAEDGGRATLRLFSEELSEYYTIYVGAAELLSTERVSSSEARKINVDREAKLLVAKERRDAAKEKRRVERERKKELERERERRGLSKASRRGRPSKSTKKSEGRHVGRRVASAHEVLLAIDEDLRPLEDLLSRVDSANAKAVEELRVVVKIDRSYRPARQLLGEFEELSERIENVSGGLEKLIESRDRLSTSIDRGELKQRDLDSKTIHITRLIDRYDAKIRELETSQQEFSRSIARVTGSAKIHNVEKAEAEQLASAADARRDAERDAKRAARLRQRAQRSEVSNRSQSAPTSSLTSSVAEIPQKSSVGSKPAATDSSTADRFEAPIEDDQDDDDDEMVAPSDSWIPLASGGLALAVIVLFVIAARSSGRREITPESVDA